ncbi:hypothetical protein PMYN1_Chma110 (chromatophore) [Paulinella micropora]|uniref:Uncharacterized protein n=1 Tax=Paulinella micropora TaxID=1928728 RepID=A0A5K7VWK2_9EUKA|nr:hypothetical protein PMYN1_Chma110 [Paulinella micropora]
MITIQTSLTFKTESIIRNQPYGNVKFNDIVNMTSELTLLLISHSIIGLSNGKDEIKIKPKVHFILKKEALMAVSGMVSKK